MKQLWANIAHTSGAKIYSMLLGMATLALTARLIGPEGRGQVAAITTWVGMFCNVAYLSLGQVALHRMAGDPKHERFGKLLGTLLLMTIILTILGWLVALSIYWQNRQGVFKGLPSIVLLIGFASLPFMIWEQYGSSLLMGLERVRTYNKYQIAGRTISLIAVVLLVEFFEQGVVGVLEASLLGQIVVALGGLGFLITFAYSKSKCCRVDWPEARALLLGGTKLHLNSIGTFLFTSVNLLILSNYHGAEQTGYFQLATQLLGVLMIIPTSASMVIYGKVTRLGPDKAWTNNKKLLIQIVLGMVVVSIVAAIFAPWLIIFIAGESFRPAVDPFKWMLPGVIGMTFSTIMAPQWIGRGYFWQAGVMTFLIGIINLIANIVLIPIYGINGAIATYLGTYVIAIVGNGFMAFHCERSSKKDDRMELIL